MEVDAVSSDILFFLGLDFIDEHQSYVHFVFDYLWSPWLDIETTLSCKYDHIYLNWKKGRIHYTYNDLVK